MRPIFRLFALLLTVGIFGCGQEGANISRDTVVIGSGSENAAFFAAIDAFAKSKGVNVQFVPKGSVDLANDLSQGANAPYDVVWPASSSVLDGIKGHAVKNPTSVMTSPVMPIVKRSKAESLGWTSRPFTSADFYKAVLDGKVRFGMTSASQSFSGQASYIGMVSALSGNPEVLTSEDVEKPGLAEKIKPILLKVARSSGSSGLLKDFMVQNVDTYDAMLNYEGLAFEANQALAAAGKKDTFCVLMPADGVVVADHPIGYVDKGDKRKEAFFKELVAHLKSPAFQETLKAHGRRTGMQLLTDESSAKHDPCWDTSRPIKLVTMPTSEVVAKAVELYQTALRKPSFTIYVADFSGSMQGEGERQVKEAMRVLFDQAEAKKWSLQPTSKDVSVFIPFSSSPWPMIEVRGNDARRYSEALQSIQSLSASGETELYLGVNEALGRLALERDLSKYSVSIIPMTDGKSEGSGYGQAIANLSKAFKQQNVAVHSILFGSADPSQLIGLAKHQVNGNEELAKAYVCDGRKDLVGCFRKVRANN
jgi:Ca-activated chloride channel family protein